MGLYRVFVLQDDGSGKTAAWPAHTDGPRGKACLAVPDSQDILLVIEHETAITYVAITAEGNVSMDVVPEE